MPSALLAWRFFLTGTIGHGNVPVIVAMNQEGNVPSIRDVAKYVGCSTSTVSRVINRRDAVDPETRRKVLDAVELLGFRPNLVAKGLRVRRGNLLGLVLPEVSTTVHSFITQHTLDAAKQRGYNVVIVNSHDDADLEERNVQDLLLRNINGIIFCRVSDESRIVSKIIRERIPIVVIDRAFELENVPNVVLDNQKAGYLAGKHLTGLNHRGIACVTGPMKITLCRERMIGFRKALAEDGIDLGSGCVFEGDFGFVAGLEALQHFQEKLAGITAIWAMNDMMAFGVLKGLYQRGIKVPDDMSVMGLDDHAFGIMSTPSLTTIHYPFKELAEKAVEIVTKQIESSAEAPETILLDPSLVVRHSTTHYSQLTTGGPDGNQNHY